MRRCDSREAECASHAARAAPTSAAVEDTARDRGAAEPVRGRRTWPACVAGTSKRATRATRATGRRGRRSGVVSLTPGRRRECRPARTGLSRGTAGRLFRGATPGRDTCRHPAQAAPCACRTLRCRTLRWMKIDPQQVPTLPGRQMPRIDQSDVVSPIRYLYSIIPQRMTVGISHRRYQPGDCVPPPANPARRISGHRCWGMDAAWRGRHGQLDR